MEKANPLIRPGMEFKERYRKKSETTHFDIHCKSPTKTTTNDEFHLGASRAHTHRPFQ